MSSGKSKTQTTTSQPWEPQGDALKELFAAAQAFFDNDPPANFSGDLVADLNPTQLAAQEQLLANVPALNESATNAITANESLFNADDVGNNQVVQDALQAALNPLSRQFSDVILPNLKIGGIGAGQTGSSRQGVLEALTTRDFEANANDLIGKLMGQFYGQGLDAKTKALSIAPSLHNLINAGAKNTAAVGDVRQGQAQSEIDAEAFKFNQDRDAELNHLINFRNLITGNFGGTTTAPTGSANPDPLGSAIGGGLLGFATTASPWGAAAGALSGLL
jgi:hypothetical protein